jgi:hypothetical protein
MVPTCNHNVMPRKSQDALIKTSLQLKAEGMGERGEGRGERGEGRGVLPNCKWNIHILTLPQPSVFLIVFIPNYMSYVPCLGRFPSNRVRGTEHGCARGIDRALEMDPVTRFTRSLQIKTLKFNMENNY